jgi:hypothetical protein
MLPVVTPVQWLVSQQSVEQGIEVIYTDEEVPPEWRYFESNPTAPSQVPEETPLISDRNQQAAQPDQAPETDELLPFQEKGDEEANKAVSGDVQLKQELLEAIEEIPVPETQQSGNEGSPFVSREEDELLPTDKDATGVTLVDPEVVEEEQSQRTQQVVVVGHVDGSGVADATSKEPRPRRPQPRPKLTPTTLPGPVVSSSRGSHRIGQVTASTRFHEFGDYLSRLIETIGYQWYSLVDATFRSTSLTSGTVRIQFTITREGIIKNVRILQEVELKQAVLICQDAIQSVSPFAEWTEQMVALLGESQEITINFIYRP